MSNNARDILSWPLDSAIINRKRKKLRRELLEEKRNWTDVRIAILGGSTTNDIEDYLELFLLAEGIRPSFYSSEYGKYWEDGMFGTPELDEFKPQIIYVHTTSRNITEWPDGMGTPEDAADLLNKQYSHFETLWDNLLAKFGCPIIQNNFERPLYRLLGNMDISVSSGNSNFVHELNSRLYEYARSHKDFFIHDVDYLSSDYGLSKWHDGQSWNLYKTAMALAAEPAFAYNLSRIVKSIYGKNKKAIALDLDNTMWGGIVGDDGVENLEIGSETAEGMGYQSFQTYLSKVKKFGTLLTIDSKNEEENAIAGLNHPESILHPDDFIVIKANWMPKDRNLEEAADEIGIGIDSFVFVDDNPAEREIVHGQHPSVHAPAFSSPDECIEVLDHSAFFEVTSMTEDDKKRSEMYQANVSRKRQEQKFENYEDYLLSLDMKASITDFEPVYIARIAQLTNKTNQFNLTTKRISEADMTHIADDEGYIRLSGRLEDKFGDNGLISVVLGKINGDELDMELWLMSCRVLKRDMEFAMFDALIEECRKRNIKRINGYYYPTAKNGMVRDFYGTLGFTKTEENSDRDSRWTYEVENHSNMNKVIEIVKK